MAETPPIYKEAGQTYAADTCVPLVQAAKAGQVRLQALVCGHYPGQKLPRGVLPGLKNVGFWDADHPQDWGLDWHRNEGIELTLVETGRLAYSVHGQDMVLKPGDLTIARPWQLHRVGNPHVAAGRLHWLILDVGVRRPHQAWKWPPWLVLSADDLKELTDMLRQNEQPVWRAPDDSAPLLCSHCAGRRGQSPQREPFPAGNSLERVVSVGFGDVSPQRRPPGRLVEQQPPHGAALLDDLAANLGQLGQEWTVPRMAEHCGLGVTHFIHHCKQITGATPLQYLNQCRLEAARQLLLRQPERSVTKIAMACGFSSSQYFSTIFGQQFGVSPRDFRSRPAQP